MIPTVKQYRDWCNEVHIDFKQHQYDGLLWCLQRETYHHVDGDSHVDGGLVNTYYKKLGVSRSMYTDGVSGIIVQTTLLVILYLVDLYKKI